QPRAGAAGVWIVGNGFGFGGVSAGPIIPFPPDRRELAARTRHPGVVWDVVAGKELKQFKGHQGEVTTLGLAPDGKTLASGSKDTTILLWDVGSLKTAPRSPVELSAREVEA